MKSLTFILLLLVLASCSRSLLKKKPDYSLEDARYLSEEGVYEEVETAGYDNKRTYEIDKFIETPYAHLKTKRFLGKRLDESHSASIRKEIIHQVPKFKRCYGKYYRKNRKGPRGQVTMNFTLNPDGQVQRAGVGESKLPLKLKACLVEVVYKINFPPSPNGDIVRVKQPLNF